MVYVDVFGLQAISYSYLFSPSTNGMEKQIKGWASNHWYVPWAQCSFITWIISFFFHILMSTQVSSNALDSIGKSREDHYYKSITLLAPLKWVIHIAEIPSVHVIYALLKATSLMVWWPFGSNKWNVQFAPVFSSDRLKETFGSFVVCSPQISLTQ